MILPGVELKIFDLGVGELPPGLTLNRGGKMTKISSWGGKIFFSLAVLKSCPCMYELPIQNCPYTHGSQNLEINVH